MKTILVPTDFSKESYNAAEYAVQLAKATKAKIVLLHVYYLPIPPPDVYISAVSYSDLQEENMTKLKRMADFEIGLNKNGTELDIQCEAVTGPITEAIIETAEKYNAGLIVMGTQGASGIGKYILGSNTANVIAKSVFPVLAIPKNAKFLGFKRFGFATNFQELKDNSSLDPMLEIALLFDSKILIVSIWKEENQIPTTTQASEALKIEKILKEVPHSFHSVISDNVADAIDEFTNTHSVDLLAMMPQKHSFLQLIFNKSITRSLVFHTQIPILTLPEKKETKIKKDQTNIASSFSKSTHRN